MTRKKSKPQNKGVLGNDPFEGLDMGGLGMEDEAQPDELDASTESTPDTLMAEPTSELSPAEVIEDSRDVLVSSSVNETPTEAKAETESLSDSLAVADENADTDDITSIASPLAIEESTSEEIVSTAEGAEPLDSAPSTEVESPEIAPWLQVAELEDIDSEVTSIDADISPIETSAEITPDPTVSKPTLPDVNIDANLTDTAVTDNLTTADDTLPIPDIFKPDSLETFAEEDIALPEMFSGEEFAAVDAAPEGTVDMGADETEAEIEEGLDLKADVEANEIPEDILAERDWLMDANIEEAKDATIDDEPPAITEPTLETSTNQTVDDAPTEVPAPLSELDDTTTEDHDILSGLASWLPDDDLPQSDTAEPAEMPIEQQISNFDPVDSVTESDEGDHPSELADWLTELDEETSSVGELDVALEKPDSESPSIDALGETPEEVSTDLASWLPDMLEDATPAVDSADSSIDSSILQETLPDDASVIDTSDDIVSELPGEEVAPTNLASWLPDALEDAELTAEMPDDETLIYDDVTPTESVIDAETDIEMPDIFSPANTIDVTDTEIASAETESNLASEAELPELADSSPTLADDGGFSGLAPWLLEADEEDLLNPFADLSSATDEAMDLTDSVNSIETGLPEVGKGLIDVPDAADDGDLAALFSDSISDDDHIEDASETLVNDTSSFDKVDLSTQDNAPNFDDPVSETNPNPVRDPFDEGLSRLLDEVSPSEDEKAEASSSTELQSLFTDALDNLANSTVSEEVEATDEEDLVAQRGWLMGADIEDVVMDSESDDALGDFTDVDHDILEAMTLSEETVTGLDGSTDNDEAIDRLSWLTDDGLDVQITDEDTIEALKDTSDISETDHDTVIEDAIISTEANTIVSDVSDVPDVNTIVPDNETVIDQDIITASIDPSADIDDNLEDALADFAPWLMDDNSEDVIAEAPFEDVANIETETPNISASNDEAVDPLPDLAPWAQDTESFIAAELTEENPSIEDIISSESMPTSAEATDTDEDFSGLAPWLVDEGMDNLDIASDVSASVDNIIPDLDQVSDTSSEIDAPYEGLAPWMADLGADETLDDGPDTQPTSIISGLPDLSTDNDSPNMSLDSEPESDAGSLADLFADTDSDKPTTNEVVSDISDGFGGANDLTSPASSNVSDSTSIQDWLSDITEDPFEDSTPEVDLPEFEAASPPLDMSAPDVNLPSAEQTENFEEDLADLLPWASENTEDNEVEPSMFAPPTVDPFAEEPLQEAPVVDPFSEAQQEAAELDTEDITETNVEDGAVAAQQGWLMGAELEDIVLEAAVDDPEEGLDITEEVDVQDREIAYDPLPVPVSSMEDTIVKDVEVDTSETTLEASIEDSVEHTTDTLTSQIDEMPPLASDPFVEETLLDTPSVVDASPETSSFEETSWSEALLDDDSFEDEYATTSNVETTDELPDQEDTALSEQAVDTEDDNSSSITEIEPVGLVSQPEPIQPNTHQGTNIQGPSDEYPDLNELIRAIDLEMAETVGSEASVDTDFGAEVSPLISPENADEPETLNGLAIETPDIEPQEDLNLERYLIFVMNDIQYGVAAANVREIGEPTNITPVPNVPQWLLGVSNLRGEILSMVDLRSFLGFEEGTYIPERQLMVARSDAGRSPVTMGLVVDDVNDIQGLLPELIKPPTITVDKQIEPYLTGVYQQGTQLIMILDFDRLLNAPEMRQFEPQ